MMKCRSEWWAVRLSEMAKGRQYLPKDIAAVVEACFDYIEGLEEDIAGWEDIDWLDDVEDDDTVSIERYVPVAAVVAVREEYL